VAGGQTGAWRVSCEAPTKRRHAARHNLDLREREATCQTWYGSSADAAERTQQSGCSRADAAERTQQSGRSRADATERTQQSGRRSVDVAEQMQASRCSRADAAEQKQRCGSSIVQELPEVCADAGEAMRI
jgi:hypothetical protein